MSLSSDQARVQYTLASSGQTLTVPFRFLAAADLSVIKTVAGVDSTLTLNTDYTVTGGGSLPAVGAVIMVAGAASDIITIYRNAQITQPSVYAANDSFPAKTTETSLDRTVMAVQQLGLINKRTLRIPISGGETADLGDKATRSGKIVGFDANGNASLSDPSAAVFATGIVIEISSVSALKAITVLALTTGMQARTSGFASGGDGGDGLFVYNSASSATENLGTVIAPNAGSGRWLRAFSGALNVKWFGAKGDNSTDDTFAIQAALNLAATGGGDTATRGIAVYVPDGVYKHTSITLKRGAVLFGSGPALTIFRKTGTTDLGLTFDSTGLTPTTVQDQVTIHDLSIWQIGAATAGAGISVLGVTSAVRLVIENVRIQNCYRGLVTSNTIQNYLKNVEIFSSVSDGFKFTGYSYLQTCIDCFASTNGTGGAGNGFELAVGNYCNFTGCAADSNASGDAFYLTGCTFCSLWNCGNERNVHGIRLINCNGCTVDTFYTLVDSYTVNAVLLDATNNTEIRNLASSHVNPAYGTYMVSAINSSVYNRLSIGYLSNAWPTGLTNSTSSFVDILQATSRRITGPLTVNGTTTGQQFLPNGALAPLPGIDYATTYANQKRIIAIYSSGNTFVGFGQDPVNLGIRAAGEVGGAGNILDCGYYSTDGAFTWTSIGKIDGQGNFTIKRGIQCTNGIFKLNLPTSAGATGELWNDAGTVKVAP